MSLWEFTVLVDGWNAEHSDMPAPPSEAEFDQIAAIVAQTVH
jgi:hypothetical protein